MRIAIGTAQFGLPYGISNINGQVPFYEVKSILDFALINEIDTIDTAIAYGESEHFLGQAGVKDFKIITKLPRVPDECDLNAWVTHQVNASLLRLGINSIYGLLLHCPEQLLEVNGTKLYRALKLLKENKLVQKIGISIYDPKELEMLISKFDFDIVQAPFNIIDRRLIDSNWLANLSSLDIELHVRSIFLQGLLLMRPNQLPSRFLKWLPLLKDWDEWLQQEKITSLQACLRYALSFSEINRVILGVDNQTQLEQIINSSKGANLEVPDIFKSEDMELINPTYWNMSTKKF